ncbi:hypothetical protein L7F22_054808 [Adiantum nelumboides]|nr:hypothetical protein [Adiantum nelumboides]
MRSGHKQELYTEETSVHGLESRPVAASINRRWSVKLGSSDKLVKNGRTTSSKQTWGGAESPVSVIGHNMSMSMQGSSNPSSGSGSMEHPAIQRHYSTAGPGAGAAAAATQYELSHRAYQHSLSTDSQLRPADHQSGGDITYADLLSARVQQAFRPRSHELQPDLVKKMTWPAPNSAISKRIEWLNLQEDAPFTTGKYPLSDIYQYGGTTDQERNQMASASSEEERLSNYVSSSRSDGHPELDDDSVIDFFPSRANRTGNVCESRMIRVGSSGKMNEAVQQDITSTIWRGSALKGRSSCMKSSAAAGGDHHHQYLTAGASSDGVSADHEGEYCSFIEGGRVSTSYKWEDAERWLTAPTTASAATPPNSLLSPPASHTMHHPLPSNVDLHGLSKAACFLQIQARKPLSGPICSTQDKYIADVNGGSHASLREAGTELVNKENKQDITTQSTPEWSRRDSPESGEPRAIIIMSTTTSSHHKIKPSCGDQNLQHDIEAPAPAQKTSPPRHNTPARRSVSCSSKERGGCRNPLPCEPVHFNSGKLNLLELESCHLDKLKLARDLPLGTASSTWVLFAEDEKLHAAESKAGKASPSQQQHIINGGVKVNMVEARVSAWEDVERAKHIAKFKRHEAKIEAWESLQRAEADAELQKLEVKLEKMRFEGREKIMGRLGVAQRRAQEMRGAAEAQKIEHLTRVATRANQIRKSGHLSSSTFNVMCSLTTKIKPSSNLSFF